MSSTTAPASAPNRTVTIESLDQDGRGVARLDGKTVFVEGALPGEAVTIATLKRKPTYELARVEAIEKASPARVEPRCPHFGVCGGCAIQHWEAERYRDWKRAVARTFAWIEE